MKTTPLRVAVVFGTRPEAIKLAPVIHCLRADKRFRCRIVVTGQHRELLTQALQTMRLVPDADLNLMQHKQTLASFVGAALVGLEAEYKKWQPDAVVIQGDTGSALAGGLAAFYQKIPVGHVEAGLRSYDHANPFPEEVNRCMVSRLATWHFAPTALAAEQLRAEGIASQTIFVTGNTVVDALCALVNPKALAKQAREPRVVVTAHRRENIGAPLDELCQAVKLLAQRHPDIEWVFPVHPNPEVRGRVMRGLAPKPRNIRLLPPMEYHDFLRFLARARLVITDSGGVQEEATVFNTPVIIVRKITERPEVLQAGGVLVPVKHRAIVIAAERCLQQPQRLRLGVSPFGDGLASERIVQALAWAQGRGAVRPKPFRFKVKA
jgi:UDP-N-acetylglucosamine 2-epimerase (non-hydrolysing)